MRYLSICGCHPTFFLILFISVFSVSLQGQDWRKFYTNTNIDRYRPDNEKLGSPEAGTDRVVLMGNSITEMWPIARPEFFEETGYVGRGISGQTTPQMLLRFRTDVISLKPKVVVILAGINDIAQNTGFIPTNMIAENIMSMSELGRQNGIEVVICSVLPAIDFPWNPGLQPAAKVLELNAILKQYAQVNEFIYVDYHSSLKDERNGLKVPEYTSAKDLVHPNAAGYEVMEPLLVDGVNKALKRSKMNVNALFSDHMVLQQQENVAIWGTAPKGTEIEINTGWGKIEKSVSDSYGRWVMRIETPAAGGPYDITISSKTNTLIVKDVMIGEVWIASGQSNMSMPLKGWPPTDPIMNSEDEISRANYPNIRMFNVSNVFSPNKEYEISGDWSICSSKNASEFSATAYFFARELNRDMDVPIGIIHSSWGGTPAESWVSAEALRALGDFDEMLDKLSDPETQNTTNEWFNRWDQLEPPVDTKGWDAIDLRDASLAQSEFDDREWKNLTLPGRVDWHNEQDVNGAFWFRKSVVIDDPTLDYTFEMGVVDDTDVVYINGERIGGTAYDFLNDRSYSIPKSLLRKGENTVAVRVIDTGGPGSISNFIRLVTGKGDTMSLNGEWKFLISAELYGGKIYNYDLSKVGELDRPDIMMVDAFSPTTLFNAMINPLLPYTLKGVIWYQGESNVGRAAQYEKLFPALINDWRGRWEQDFPFYFVQLAPFNYNNGLSPALRDAQRRTLSIKNTGMAVTMDIGNSQNIHPGNKQEVGKRLAMLALGKDYGKELVFSGPLYRDHQIESRKVVISFDHVGDGLVLKGQNEFEIAGEDKKFVKATARIKKNQLELFSADVKSPRYVRYAWRDDSTATLFNLDGLPASPFTTED